MTDVDCQVMRCPELDKPLWLLIDGSKWIRTSPTTSVGLDDRAGIVVTVCTRDAHYQLVFDRSQPFGVDGREFPL